MPPNGSNKYKILPYKNMYEMLRKFKISILTVNKITRWITLGNVSIYKETRQLSVLVTLI